MQSSSRQSLPSDADNYDVFCERCGRVHRYYAFTKEDYDRVVTDGARRLADEIDRRAAEAAYSQVIK